MLKNNKGITLIALVITIIVLLILAGISIAMLTGNNGLLTKANDAKKDTATAEAVERINLELNALYASVMASSTKTTFEANEISSVKSNLTSDEGYTVTPTPSENPTKIEITSNVSGVTGGSVEITSAGQGKLIPAKQTTPEEGK